MADESLIARMFKENYYYRLPLAGGFVFLFLLLFVDKLGGISGPAQQWLLPSLAVYILASNFVCFFHETVVNRYKNNQKKPFLGVIPCWLYIMIVLSQVALLVVFVWYNVWRQVL